MCGYARGIEQNFLQPTVAAGASTVLFRRRGLGRLLCAIRPLAGRGKPPASHFTSIRFAASLIDRRAGRLAKATSSVFRPFHRGLEAVS